MTLVQTSIKVDGEDLKTAKKLGINVSLISRKALAAAIFKDTEDVEKEEEAIQIERAVLAAREERLRIKKERRLQENIEAKIEADRRKFLNENPILVNGYKKGTITNKGYQKLGRGLNLSTKKAIQEYLIKYMQEQENVLKPNQDKEPREPQPVTV